MTIWRQIFVALVSAFVLSACVSTSTMQTTNAFERIEGAGTLLLLEPDVELARITASEVRETRADWTAEAEQLLVASLKNQLGEKDLSVTEFSMDDATPRDIQLVKLHEAVGNTILLHRFFNQPLPSKRDKFDWTLGPGVAELGERTGSDYGLLLFARGEYAGAAKQTLNVLMIAAGVGSGSMGGQVAFASLIDLRTGDIVWFNLAQMGSGRDMRRPGGAEALVASLLKDLPL